MAREDELLRRFRADGDGIAMDAFVAATRPRLVAIARRIGAPQDAEDSVQAAYHALLRRADLPGEWSVVGWLVTAVVRIAYRRKAAARRQDVLAERLARSCDDAAPEQALLRDEEDGIVRAAVHRLPERYRDVLVLHHLEGLPLADVARLLDVPEATAKTRAQRGRALLRMRLAPRLAFGLVVIPWWLADGLRGLGVPGSVIGGVMQSKLAVGALVLVGVGLGTAIGVGVASPATPAPPAVAAASSPLGEAPPRRAPSAPSLVSIDADARPERVRRADAAPALTLDDVRRVVAEEFARREGQAALPALPPPTDVGLNADPALREKVRRSVLDIRRDMIQYELYFDVGAIRQGIPLAPPDPSRVEKFGDERVWPSRQLGWVQRDPAAYEILASDARGFDGTRDNAAWVFTAPLDHAISTERYATLVFEEGVRPGGRVSVQSFGTIRCKGNFDGTLSLDSYATVLVDGDFTGTLTAASYATIHVGGRFTGSFEAQSYANLRVLGGFQPAKATLRAATNFYLGGYTSDSVLDSIVLAGAVGESGDSKSRVNVVLERGDHSPGTYQRPPSMDVTVLEPR